MKTRPYHELPNGQPAISCFDLSENQLQRREARAGRRFDEAVKLLDRNLTEAERMAEVIFVARRILWHTDFPTGLRLLVSDNQLYRLTADLPSQLEEANGGQPLDFWDYAYVADVLRELLLDCGIPPGDLLLMRRALAWAEKIGERLDNHGY